MSLLPSDNIRAKIKEALEIVKYLKPTVCQNTMSQEDYLKLNSLLNYFRKYFSLNSKPFCKECRVYYGLSTGNNCYQCKIATDTYFGKLRKSDFQYPKVKDHYKGTVFKHLLEEKPEVSPKERFKKFLENQKK